MTEQLEGQVSIFGPDSAFGKMFPEPSVRTEERTSKQSSKRCATCVTPMLQFLCLKETNGFLPDASWETATALPGVSSTLNTTERPNDVRESTLSQTLDLSAPAKYNLSGKACLGILRRAEKRQKELPPMLMEALLETVNDGLPWEGEASKEQLESLWMDIKSRYIDCE